MTEWRWSEGEVMFCSMKRWDRIIRGDLIEYMAPCNDAQLVGIEPCLHDCSGFKDRRLHTFFHNINNIKPWQSMYSLAFHLPNHTKKIHTLISPWMPCFSFSTSSFLLLILLHVVLYGCMIEWKDSFGFNFNEPVQWLSLLVAIVCG